MRHYRRPIVSAVLTMLLTAGGWFALHASRAERALIPVRVAEWQPETWYPLEGSGSSAICELPAGHRYRLVLGCLSDATQEHVVSVQLTDSQSVPRGRRSNLRRATSLALPVAELARVQIRSLATSATGNIHPAARLRADPLNRPIARWFSRSVAPISSPTNRKASNQPLAAPREFFLHVTDGELNDSKQYARIVARNAACGTCVRVFVDQQLASGEVPQARIDELVHLLESDVLPRVESQFGPLSDIDGDGGLTILLTPWLSRLQGGRTSIGGMVRTTDFQRDVSPPFGNRCDMLVLNSSLPAEAALRDLVSHEVTHAACISQRLSHETGLLRDEEDWLSEALAHLAEPGWSNLEHRLVAFLNDPSRSPLVVPDYYRAGLWRDPGCRGATFLFTRWCVEHHQPPLVRQLAQSTERGTRNLERATGRKFEELFRDWTLSLASGDELASPDLQRVLQRLGSVGLQSTICDAISSELQQSVRGTAFAVVDLVVEESAPRRLCIAGDSSTKWQFSICRCIDKSRERSANGALAAIHP